MTDEPLVAPPRSHRDTDTVRAGEIDGAASTPADTPAPEPAPSPTHITETKWFRDVLKGIYGPRKGGCRGVIDAAGAATGVGKTSLAVAIGRLFARVFDYEISPEDLTLSGQQYLQRWREHPGSEQPSVIILDELAGAGAGDARRAMSTQSVNLGRAWQLMRKKRIVTLVTLPHWSDADKRLRRFADYRLHCSQEPIGYFTPYEVGTSFANGDVRLHGYDDVSRIAFPDMDGNDDPLFRELERKKDALLESQYFDADELHDDPDADDADEPDPDEVRREEQLKTALRLCKPWSDGEGLSYTDAASHLDYGSSWIGARCREWKNGEHRALVEAPPTAEV